MLLQIFRRPRLSRLIIAEIHVHFSSTGSNSGNSCSRSDFPSIPQLRKVTRLPSPKFVMASLESAEKLQPRQELLEMQFQNVNLPSFVQQGSNSSLPVDLFPTLQHLSRCNIPETTLTLDGAVRGRLDLASPLLIMATVLMFVSASSPICKNGVG